MRIAVDRIWYTPNSVTGKLYVDDQFECYTLEPPEREEKPRCIPEGSYQVLLLPSERFETVTPHILDVPGFTGIEIHWGNRPADTHGCLLVGAGRLDDWVCNSRDAFYRLMMLFRSQPDQLTITYARYIPPQDSGAGLPELLDPHS